MLQCLNKSHPQIKQMLNVIPSEFMLSSILSKYPTDYTPLEFELINSSNELFNTKLTYDSEFNDSLQTTNEEVQTLMRDISARFDIDIFVDNKLPVAGRYENGRIYINMSKANTNVLFHELAHPIVQMIKELDNDNYNSLLSELYTNPYGIELLSKAKQLYSDKDLEIQEEEALVELIANYSSGKLLTSVNEGAKLIQENISLFSKLKLLLKDFANMFMNLFSNKNNKVIKELNNNIGVHKLANTKSISDIVQLLKYGTNIKLRTTNKDLNENKILQTKLSKQSIESVIQYFKEGNSIDIQGEQYSKDNIDVIIIDNVTESYKQLSELTGARLVNTNNEVVYIPFNSRIKDSYDSRFDEPSNQELNEEEQLIEEFTEEPIKETESRLFNIERIRQQLKENRLNRLNQVDNKQDIIFNNISKALGLKLKQIEETKKDVTKLLQNNIQEESINTNELNEKESNIVNENNELTEEIKSIIDDTVNEEIDKQLEDNQEEDSKVNVINEEEIINEFETAPEQTTQTDSQFTVDNSATTEDTLVEQQSAPEEAVSNSEDSAGIINSPEVNIKIEEYIEERVKEELEYRRGEIENPNIQIKLINDTYFKFIAFLNKSYGLVEVSKQLSNKIYNFLKTFSKNTFIYSNVGLNKILDLLKSMLNLTNKSILKIKQFLLKLLTHWKKTLTGITLLGGALFSQTTMGQDLIEMGKYYATAKTGYVVEVANVKIDSSVNLSNKDIINNANDKFEIQTGYQEIAKVPDNYKSSNKDSLISYRSQWLNEEGFNYVISANKNNPTANRNQEFDNVMGVGHFLIDTDMSKRDATMYYNPKGRPDEWFPVFTKIKDVNNAEIYKITYKQGRDVKNNDNLVTPLVQFKVSNVDFNSRGKLYKSSDQLMTFDGKPTGLLFNDKNKYGRFNGNSVVFIFKVNNQVVIRDFAGSINQIENEISLIKKDYNLSNDEIIIGRYDAGSYSAKPASKNNKLNRNQWYNFNPTAGGSALMIPTLELQKELSTIESKLINNNQIKPTCRL